MKKHFFIALSFFMIFLCGLGIIFHSQIISFTNFSGLYGWPIYKKAFNFHLKNHENKTIQLSDMSGKYRFLYFGYTQCKIICPQSMGRLYRIAQEITREDVEFIFISIDPKRDTLAKLKKYKKAFGSKFTVLTSYQPNILKKVTREYKIIASVAPSDLGRDFNHSDYIYLIDKKGIIRVMYINSHQNIKKIIQDIEKLG